jgi:hypothetical protein
MEQVNIGKWNYYNQVSQSLKALVLLGMLPLEMSSDDKFNV